ncbi:MAG: hypothetical protein HY657_00380 [Acidobacteria bacterium]|nr:hypothetical protein [Acidobacteriota bacterium]
MIDTTDDLMTAPVLAGADDDRGIRARVRAEYQEMPGLSLTVSQAARLFDLELTQCERVLGDLVADGHLWTNGREFLGPNVGRRFA